MPILHVNGYKINNPAVLGRLSEKELTNLFQGYGYQPCFVERAEPEAMHQLMAATLDAVLTKSRRFRMTLEFENSRGTRFATLTDRLNDAGAIICSFAARSTRRL